MERSLYINVPADVYGSANYFKNCRLTNKPKLRDNRFIKKFGIQYTKTKKVFITNYYIFERRVLK
ncbi:hypothetical protein GCM10010916_09940 [Paenibacillus abyssi]|uniref:Uncharacterized protein n=1 Tax=Paenibacillus abyssi TaxID=1340531 RepID=A0A917CS44_9BACL|nr:hypothetical protein GCM10010916_09940 [Paenibacillus abyssi]